MVYINTEINKTIICIKFLEGSDNGIKCDEDAVAQFLYKFISSRGLNLSLSIELELTETKKRGK